MDKIKLTNIYESIVTSYGIDFSQTPYIVNLLGKIKPKPGGGKVITDQDFKALLGNNRASQNILTYIVNGNYKQNYSIATALGRVYNFYKELVIAIQSGRLAPQQEQMYQGAIDEIQEIANDIITTNKRRRFQSIASTQFLSKSNKTVINNQTYTITDSQLQVFNNDQNPNINKYYNAIMSGDVSLTSDNTPEGLVYGLYKGLRIACQQTMGAYTKLMDKMKTLNFVQSDGSVGSKKQLISIKMLELDTLPDNADIELSYTLANYSTGKPYKGVTQVYTGLYDFYKRRRTYEFINKRDKNNFFEFVKPIPSKIEVGYEYYIKLDTDKIKSEYVRIQFTDIKANKGQDFSEFINCNAVDELKNILESIRNTR